MKHEKCGREMKFFTSKIIRRIEMITYACGNCEEFVVVSRPAATMPHVAYHEMRYGAKAAYMMNID